MKKRKKKATHASLKHTGKNLRYTALCTELRKNKETKIPALMILCESCCPTGSQNPQKLA